MTSRRSSGSMRAESAVEPTKSENITVTWRRSASRGLSADAPTVGVPRLATASRNFLRAPRGRPSSLRSASVNFGNKDQSISLSAKTVWYFASPIAPSHSAIWRIARVRGFPSGNNAGNLNRYGINDARDIAPPIHKIPGHDAWRFEYPDHYVALAFL